MKKSTILLSVLLVGTLLLGTALAAGGDAGDPLIPLSYLQNVFAPAAEAAAQAKIDAAGNAVYSTAEATWRAAVDAVDAASGTQRADRWGEARLKQGDVLTVPTGAQVILLAGNALAQCPSGAMVDVTDGTEYAVATLQARHRYLVAEDSTGLFAVTSRTAVILYSGGTLTPSANVPDYNAMASALKALSLFRGTGSGIGEGFDLEAAPDRIQALVMLIRLLGEEEAALASPAPQPFDDVPVWADRYVAYAYERGYTNGVSATHFAPSQPCTPGIYVEFILRALGYSDTTQTDVSTAPDRALQYGVITPGEREFLRANDFLRADVVYLSWYALGVPLPGSAMTLREKLEGAGVFTEAAYQSACLLVDSERIR